jgi:pyruvate/2-oxoglutarate/acetoin dehydrogenase E1 component
MHQGVYGVSTLIYEEFGSDRVRPTPISENAMVGCAVGAAMTGLRPIVEIMFADFLMECMDPIVNQAAKLRYMTGGQATLPLVVRVPGGSGFAAGARPVNATDAMMPFPLPRGMDRYLRPLSGLNWRKRK